MGHIDSFEIFLDNELAIYHEGDHVTGKVKIVNAEVIKYKCKLNTGLATIGGGGNTG